MRRLLVGVLLLTAWTTGVATTPASAAYPGQNGRIAFHRADGALYSVRPDGTGLLRLGAGAQAAWSPDGRRIAFVSGGDVWTMSQDGSDRRRVTATSDDESGPTWSPDGGRLAFASSRGAGGIDTLRSVPPYGRPVRVAATPTSDRFTATDSSPSWGTNGLISFTRATDNAGTLCEDGIETMSVDPVTRTVRPWAFFAVDADPAPRARAVVYAHELRDGSCGTEYGIAIADVDGSDPRAVTPLRAETPRDRDPVFSPDATKVAFQRGRYVMVADATGGAVRQLTVGSAPSWQPLRP
jgi:Tol biopolymer transport system component